MKFLSIKIGEFSPIFCIYGDEGRGLHSQRDGAKAVSEAESIFVFVKQWYKGVGRASGSGQRQAAQSCGTEAAKPHSGGVADGVDGRLSRLLQNGKDRRRERDDKA